LARRSAFCSSWVRIRVRVRVRVGVRGRVRGSVRVGVRVRVRGSVRVGVRVRVSVRDWDRERGMLRSLKSAAPNTTPSTFP
jgi:predicted pyridoxine 5'-phosphate oxidase superfamily flavin-nucleotide-binding protein